MLRSFFFFFLFFVFFCFVFFSVFFFFFFSSLKSMQLVACNLTVHTVGQIAEIFTCNIFPYNNNSVFVSFF